jgi:hypothetical protein
VASWFQGHRGIQITALLAALAGFIIALVRVDQAVMHRCCVCCKMLLLLDCMHGMEVCWVAGLLGGKPASKRVASSRHGSKATAGYKSQGIQITALLAALAGFIIVLVRVVQVLSFWLL